MLFPLIGRRGTIGNQAFRRPECVLTNSRGVIFASDERGGVACLDARGVFSFLGGLATDVELIPNGIALLRDGSFLIANLGPDGGVWHLKQDRQLRPWLTEVEGRRLPATNFVGLDATGRIWISISTWQVPRWDAYRRGGAADGAIVLVDERGPRIVAEGFAYTNEVKVDPSGEWLYVNETVGRRTRRFRLKKNGSLGKEEIVAEFGAGDFPDGIGFDEEGWLWITSVVSNRIYRIFPDTGKRCLIYEDSDCEVVQVIEEQFVSGRVPGHEPGMHGISSIAFGGVDKRKVVLGFSKGNSLSVLHSAVAGTAPPHWHF